MLDFETYAAFFALTPEKQANVARSVRDDAECNAPKQSEAEQACVATELEKQENARATQELMAATVQKGNGSLFG